MKILILGATGRTGKLILEEALNQDYEVNCLVREPKRIKANHEKLKILKGSPEQISDLENALKGCKGIISALNISRKSDFPWSKLRTPPTFLSDIMKNIISLTEKNGLERIVSVPLGELPKRKKKFPFGLTGLSKTATL
jgi:putative NADH-flavin reductase